MQAKFTDGPCAPDLVAALQELIIHVAHTENMIAERAIPGMSVYFDELRGKPEEARTALAKAGVES